MRQPIAHPTTMQWAVVHTGAALVVGAGYEAWKLLRSVQSAAAQTVEDLAATAGQAMTEARELMVESRVTVGAALRMVQDAIGAASGAAMATGRLLVALLGESSEKWLGCRRLRALLSARLSCLSAEVPG